MTYWTKTLKNFCFNLEKTGLTFDESQGGLVTALTNVTMCSTIMQLISLLILTMTSNIFKRKISIRSNNTELDAVHA